MRRSALFLFTRAALIALGLLVVLSAGSLALSRGDAYRCVVLYDGYTVAPVTYILDTATGHTVLDRREVQRLYSIDSPDGTARAGFVQRFGERATMTLLLDTPQGQRIVQTGIDASSQSNGFQQIAGWSGDSQYLVIAEFDGRRFYHHIFNAADLTPQPSPLATLPVLTAELAPHGTQIAAISIDAVGAAHLVLADVSGARDLIDVPLQHDALSWRLAWSPTGAHVAVERISGCQTASCAEAGWHFEIYTPEGTPAAPSLRGLGLGGSASGILPAQWQGDQWVWVERVADGGRYDLVRLDVPTGARTLLVPDLVPEYADDLFFVPPNAVWNSIFTNGAIFPISAEPRAIVPFYDGELLGVDLVDTATGIRTELLRGVDMLAHTHFGSGSDFWWGGADSAWVSWIAPNGDAFLTVIDTRAGTASTSPASRAVWRPQWIAADAIGFIDPRPDDYALMLFDTVAGTATPLIRVDPNTIAWRAALTIDSGMVAAAAGGSDFIGKPLTLIDLVDASTQRVLSHESAGTFVWSPDGTRIAFAENSNRQANIAISDRLGSAVQRFTPPQFTTTPFIQFVAWTQC
ncbi:MAG: PD40 domain-containing protein [Chloroflexi bacterium]|nr:PD40 domain-containing protein [Chloroflexota bacterium]